MCCGVNSRNLKRGSVTLRDLEKNGEPRVLVRGKCIRVESTGRVNQVHSVCCTTQMNQGTRIASILVAVNVLDKQWVGRSLPLNHPRKRRPNRAEIR